MSEDGFDERQYLRILTSGSEDALQSAVVAFSAFGYRKNMELIAETALSVCDYTGEKSYAALRCSHSSKHISQYLEGRKTWLPLLQTAALFRFYGKREDLELRGGSLTAKQLNLELLASFTRGEWSRGAGLAKEMAMRGENESLLSALRSEAVRRHSTKSFAYTVWNAVRCIAHSDSELLAESVADVVYAISNEDVTGGLTAARRYLSSANLNAEKLVESNDSVEESDRDKIVEAMRSGLPELAAQLVVRQLGRGSGLSDILEIVGIETLRQSFNTSSKEMFEVQLETIAAMTETNRTEEMLTSQTAVEVIIACMDTTSISSSMTYRRRREKQISLQDAAELMEKGSAGDIISIVEAAKNKGETDKPLQYMVLSSLKCDPAGVSDHPFSHCSNSIYIGEAASDLEGRKSAITECADYVADQFSKRKSCDHRIWDLTERRREISDEEE